MDSVATEMEDVTYNPTPNTPSNLTPNTFPNPILNTTPTTTPNTTPIELKSPKKEDVDESLTDKKKPTRTSGVWDHFTKVKGGDTNNPRCKCNYCGADYACHSTRVGTSSLWVHFNKCKKNPTRVADKKQKVLSFKKETGGGSNLLAVTFNKVRCRSALAKFVVKDEQAFRVVKGHGFKDLVQELQPMYDEEDDKFVSYFMEKENDKKRMGPPTATDWHAASIFVKFLAIFYEVILKFSSTLHVTSNNFYHEICEVQSILSDLATSGDPLYLHWLGA
ncbi:hypothetical protein POM88_000378 [Heracleum sosnowskyi]|uniref:BED-type domain-containing protein n=1 Tax=Heracleum sosnowskyi TaxID=360622 RepID=A0AAD8NAS9_9APIA|nr:hypothetical protein POM88_000378 [Heracleum sosnowskyi]